jgi:hypothetical protein
VIKKMPNTAIALSMVACMFAFIGIQLKEPEQKPFQVGALMIAVYFAAMTTGYIHATEQATLITRTPLIAMLLIVRISIGSLFLYTVYIVINLLNDTGMNDKSPFEKSG